MQSTEPRMIPGGYRPRFRWGIIGSAAPVFPGFEVDALRRIPDDEKPDAVWHRERARAILRAHPEVKSLFGHAPVTAVFCVAAAALQLALAALAAVYLPWWGVLILAWCVGAPLNIVLFQLTHECDHSMVFRKTRWNRWMFTLTSLPMFLWAHHTWWTEHLIHHYDMGATKDFISRRRTFFLISRPKSPLFFPYALPMIVLQAARSLFGLAVYVVTSLLRGRLAPTDFALAVLGEEHLISAYRKDRTELWAVVYPLCSLLMTVLLVGFFGWKTVLYLIMSEVFFTGFLHPYCLGLVLGTSHFHGRRRYQPTASHYGRFVNLVTFNLGLHVEHHDIAGIPWFRLGKLRRIAPEFYDSLEPIRSYTMLGLKFVFADDKTFDDEFNEEAYRNVKRFGDEASSVSRDAPVPRDKAPLAAN